MAAELPNCGDYEGRSQMKDRSRTHTHSRIHAKIVVAASAAAALLGTSPITALAGTPTQADADARIEQMLSAKTAAGSCTVIARLTGGLSAEQQAQLAALGADTTCHLGFIHSLALTLPERNLRKLAALPFVSHLSYDGAVKKCDEFTVASSGAGTAYGQYGLTGQGVSVAVLDSGLSPEDDLLDPVSHQTRIQAQRNFVPGTSDYTDRCGHGTHVAGILAGAGQDSTGSQYSHTFYGIARRVGLVNARVLDANGQGTVSSTLAALQWVIVNKNAYNIRVINLSLGHPVGESYKTDPLCQAVESAWNAGIVVVCAAGNGGRQNAASTPGAANEGWGTAYGSIQSPANDPYVLTVGATKSTDGAKADDKIATYSSRGPSRLDLVLKPDIIAPGNRVVSLSARNSTLFRGNAASGNGLSVSAYEKQARSGTSSSYFVLSGTSMAAPVVAGAAALLLEQDPTLTPDTIKARLMVSADKWADPNGILDPCTYGAGYLNIPAALASGISVSHSALSPQLTLTATGGAVITTNVIGSTNIWGSQAIKGVSALYGSQVFGGGTVWGIKAPGITAKINKPAKPVCGSGTGTLVLTPSTEVHSNVVGTKKPVCGSGTGTLTVVPSTEVPSLTPKDVGTKKPVCGSGTGTLVLTPSVRSKVLGGSTGIDKTIGTGAGSTSSSISVDLSAIALNGE